MLLFWRIRYLDCRDKLFKNRDLWLDTNALDPVMKAALETIYALKNTNREREVLGFRHLFREMTQSEGEYIALVERHGSTRSVFLHDYFEDETGQELSRKRMAVTITGNPQADYLPPGTTKKDIDFYQAEKPPIDPDRITLSPDQLGILGYFVRDLREMMASALYKNGPGTLSRGGSRGHRWVVETAASDEEIRSFVTIFRRLYMDKEPANFAKAVAVFSEALQGHAMAKWVQGMADQHENGLNDVPSAVPFIGPGKLSFTQKRLIDAYVYTQYAHQPDEKRTRQFNECLASVNGDQSLLTYLFLTELWKCALRIRNAGVFIEQLYDRYCQTHNVVPSVLASMRTDHPGLGALEKQEDREARVLEEKMEELAKSLWQSAGQPEGGHTLFLQSARKQLLSVLGKVEGTRMPSTAITDKNDDSVPSPT